MEDYEWKDLFLQAIMGGLYGLSVGLVATNDFSMSVGMALGVAFLKGAAHQIVRILRPRMTASSMKYRSRDWSETFDRIL